MLCADVHLEVKFEGSYSKTLVLLGCDLILYVYMFIMFLDLVRCMVALSFSYLFYVAFDGVIMAWMLHVRCFLHGC